MRSRGFTLLELLVVLAILGMLLATVPAGLGSAVPSLRLRGSARDLVAVLRSERAAAVEAGTETVFVPGALKLPSGASLRLDDAPGGAAPEVRFFPDGSSTGGRLVLSQGTRVFRIEIDWLTGKAALDG